jgi:hypothetical protein
MPGAFMYADVTNGAAVTSPAAIMPTLPLSQLADPQPRARVRLMGSAPVLVFDLLTARSIDAAALVSTTLTAAATVRVRLSTADATGAAGDAWDGGVVAAGTGPEVNGNVVLVRSAGPASGRYLRWDIEDLSPSQIDVGLAPAGALWRLARSHDYGIVEGRVIMDTRDRNPLTGAEFPAAAVSNPRYARFTLSMLTTDEARGAHRALVAALGAAGDGLWIPDLGLSRAEMNARVIWGGLNAAGASVGATHRAYPAHSRAFAIVERL